MRIALYATLLTCGCAGTDGTFVGESDVLPDSDIVRLDEPLRDESEEVAGESELGTLEQALLEVPGIAGLPDGYGIDATGNRCWTEGGAFAWNGSLCSVPVSTSGWTVYVPTSANNKGCTSSNIRTAIRGAALLWRGYLSTAGWSMNVVEGPEVAGDKKFAIKCSTATPVDSNGAPIYATAFMPLCGSANTHSCGSTPYGTLLRYKDMTHIMVYPGNSGTDIERVHNVVAHELGHAFGLGHDLGNETCLMAANLFDPLCSSPDVNPIRSPTQFEADMLFDVAH